MDDTALLSAASKADAQALRSLLAAGGYQPSQLNRALMRAVIWGHASNVQSLLAHGADVNHNHSGGETPLFYAVGVGLPMVRLLLEHGADARVRSDSGTDPLHRYLLDVGPGSRLGTGDVALVKALIDAGLDVRHPHVDWSHLGAASVSGRPEIVTLLLESGADPNAPNRGLEVVGRAVQSREARAVLAALVRGGLSPDATTGPSDYNSVLTEVCRLGDLETAQLLIDRGADVNAGGRATPLSCAEQSGNPALVDLLLERGARPLSPRLAAAVTKALDDAEAAAKANPGDPTARLEWARTLASNGFRAASAWEVHLLRGRGVTVPAALDALLGFESPAGVWWRFAPFQSEGAALSQRTDDARVPGAWVTDGTRTLPLTIALGTPCTRCDEKGEQLCTSCNGTGSYSSFLDPDHDVDCEPRARCGTCRGLKFKVTGERLGRGGCGHRSFVDELELAPFTFKRCAVCGLGALFGPVHDRHRPWDDDFACRHCGRFECRCDFGSTEKELSY